MSGPYRICHNCGEALAPGQTRCPRCGAVYAEPIMQKPGEFEPFPPDPANAAAQTEPYEVQPQQPVVLPPPQQQAPYPPPGQGYVQPSSYPSQYATSGYNQQAPGQVGGPPQPPESDTTQGLNISLIIGLMVAVVLLLLLIGGLFFVLGQRNNNTPASTPTPGVTPTPTPTATPGTTPTPTPTPVPFQVTTINLSVDPLSFDGQPCGKQVTFTYTATFNVLPKGPGGGVQFTYTTDGGRTHKTGVVQFSPGQTSMQFKFTSSGTLALNGAFPGAGQVTTTSPNIVSSQAVTPSGSCTPVSPTP
jgi:hypothetical protein